jgi:ferredoxin
MVLVPHYLGKLSMTKNKSIKYTLKPIDCCGCKLCADACPKKCISFATNNEGFFMPVVDEDICINCELCSKSCPELNVSLHPEAPYAISAYAKDAYDHNSGSSGGFFAVVARHYLNNNGKVYGAAFDEDLRLRHVGIDKISDLRPLCKSKYLQSDCLGIYKQVKADLLNDKKVLFVGTPCQCQALSNFISNKLRGNLLIIDFVCHGVSCQKLFDDNIQWNETKYGKIIGYQFRNKEKAKYHHSLKLTYLKQGYKKTKIVTYFEDPYYYGYERRMTLRESCYRCKWAGTRRSSDITMSDFFGLHKIDKTVSGNYASCILCNSEKGEKAIEFVKSSIDSMKQYDISDVKMFNECLRQPVKKPVMRDLFFLDWKEKGFDSVIKTYLTPKHKWIYRIYYSIPQNVRKLIR